MRTQLVLIFGALLLAACGGSSTQTPSPPSNALWGIFYSQGTPPALSPVTGGYGFTFPLQSQGAIDYVYKNQGAIPVGGTVSMTFTVSGAGGLVATQGTAPAAVRLFLQRMGDNLSGTGVYEFYRLWSQNSVVLKPGALTLSENWIGVFGRPPTAAQLADTLGKLAHIGFTFGGEFAGHGVYATGPLNFVLTSFAP